jgi:hypothetical protein
MSPNTSLTVPAGGAVITRAGAMAALFVVLEKLDAGQLDALTDYARELAGGLVPVPGHQAHDDILTPLSEADSPLAALVNSVLGLGEGGARRRG